MDVFIKLFEVNNEIETEKMAGIKKFFEMKLFKIDY